MQFVKFEHRDGQTIAVFTDVGVVNIAHRPDPINKGRSIPEMRIQNEARYSKRALVDRIRNLDREGIRSDCERSVLLSWPDDTPEG